jgi:hypothetical protein
MTTQPCQLLGEAPMPMRLGPNQPGFAIERLAASDLRSVNAQIEFLLREALKKRGVTVKGE